MSCWVKPHLKGEPTSGFSVPGANEFPLSVELGFLQLVTAEKYSNNYKQLQYYFHNKRDDCFYRSS